MEYDGFYGPFGSPFDPATSGGSGGDNDFRWRWVQDGRSFYLREPYGLEKWDDSGFVYAIPESESPGVSNTYAESSYAKPRDITINGQVVAGNPTHLRDAFDILAGVFPEGSGGKLYRTSNRYVNASVGLFREAEPDEGFNDRKWVLGLRCHDPFYYSDAPEDSLSLVVSGTGGTLSFTPGGSASALPVITLVVGVSGIGKTITLTSPGNALACVFTPPSAGTYLLDSAEGTITKTGSGADFLFYMDGDLLSLRHYATSITTALEESGILTSASVTWTRRWRSG